MNSDNLKYLIDTPNSKLIIWHDSTFSEKIKKGLKKKDIETQAITEKLVSIDKNLLLKHKASGAPYTLNSIYTHISISHYGGHYAIYLSNIPIGVDIQVFKDSLKKGKHYFVNENEESNIELTKTNLHLIWTAKEAFYKKNSGEIDDLKNEVSLVNINESNKIVSLKYGTNTFFLNYSIFKDYVVSWT